MSTAPHPGTFRSIDDPGRFSHVRRNVWPILGHTTLDAVRVMDWAMERFVLLR
ncbi:MAG TPA: hypothetical protein VI094_07240 [Propionibacteriaceae bacterium]